MCCVEHSAHPHVVAVLVTHPLIIGDRVRHDRPHSEAVTAGLPPCCSWNQRFRCVAEECAGRKGNSGAKVRSSQSEQAYEGEDRRCEDSDSACCVSGRDLAILNEVMAKHPSPVVCSEAGLEPLTEKERVDLIASFDGEATIRAFAAIQSLLDVATSTDWTQSRVERDLLASVEFPYPEELVEHILSGNRLIPPQSATQLLRETLESAVVRPEAEPISTGTLVHLILSITTSNLRNQLCRYTFQST